MNGISIKDLRVGNKIIFIICDINDSKLDEYREITVTSSDYIFIEENHTLFKPIPITKEWLLKFGFEKKDDLTFSLKNEQKGYINEFEFFFEPNEEVCITYRQFYPFLKETDSVFLRNLEYVHQLQNLYFALTGEDLEVSEG